MDAFPPICPRLGKQLISRTLRICVLQAHAFASCGLRLFQCHSPSLIVIINFFEDPIFRRQRQKTAGTFAASSPPFSACHLFTWWSYAAVCLRLLYVLSAHIVYVVSLGLSCVFSVYTRRGTSLVSTTTASHLKAKIALKLLIVLRKKFTLLVSPVGEDTRHCRGNSSY